MQQKKKIQLIGAAILAVLTLIVILQNLEPAPTEILFVTIEMPRALLLGVTLLIGFVVGLLVAARMDRRARSKSEKNG